MTAMQQNNLRFVVADLIPHPVVSNTNAILVLVASQFYAATGAWIALEIQDFGDQSTVDRIRKVVELFLDRFRNDDKVVHES